MFSSIRKRVKLTPSGVIAVLALVFAMSGGAYAAGKYLITSTKQIKPSVLASLKGKAGPAGANGASGANGVAGEKGAQGPQGPQGPEGKEGKQGEPGKEGKAGTNGTTGFTETLPPGKTETGTWSYGIASTSSAAVIPISFTIPLSAKLTETQVHYINSFKKEVIFPEPTKGLIFGGISETEQSSTQCSGTVEAPTAEPGNLCVYTGENSGVKLLRFAFQNPAHQFPSTVETGTTGTAMWMSTDENGDAFGTWAVTAPAEA